MIAGIIACGVLGFKNFYKDTEIILGDSSTALRVASTTLIDDPNLVSLWEFEQNMNDTVGTNDSAGNPAAYGTSTPYGYGLFDYGGYFNNSEFDFPTNNYQWTGFTFNVWLKFVNPTDADGKIFDFKGNDRLYGSIQPDGTFAGVFTTYQPNLSAYQNTWVMLTYTRGATGSFVYLNGNSVAITSSTATTLDFWQTSGTLGDEAAHTANRHYKGSMDDASLFSRVLTASEIASLYSGNWVAGGVTIPANLIIFDEE